MAGNRIKRFANKKFLENIDAELLARFFKSHKIPESRLNLDELDRNAVWEYLTEEPDFDSELNRNLHRVFELSTETGAEHLRNACDLDDIEFVKAADFLDDEKSLKLDPSNISMRTFLERRDVFDRAYDWLTFDELKSPDEYVGESENVEIKNSADNWKLFENEAAEYFNGRYKGNYCRTRHHQDENELIIIVIHGKLPVTTTTVENQEEKPITFRETTQSILAYDSDAGRLKVGAHGEESKTLARLFAIRLLERPEFFEHNDSKNLYTLAPIKRSQSEFVFSGYWDDSFRRCKITEIQVCEGRRRGWRITVHDPENALALLLKQNEQMDLTEVEISYVKMQMEFFIDGRPRKKTIKIKPPSVASFDRKDLEEKVMEQLKHNGFCIERRPSLISA